MREIYEEAFPAWEREDFEELLHRGINRDNQQLACIVGQQIVGFATLSILHSIEWNFLEYFALDPSLRGQGLGSELWTMIKTRLHGPVVIEVEHPEQFGASDTEISIRQDRIRFWLHAGFNEIPIPNYCVPRADSQHFEPLILMTNTPPVPPLCSPQSIVAALYAEGYDLEDAQERAAIAMVPRTPTA